MNTSNWRTLHSSGVGLVSIISPFPKNWHYIIRWMYVRSFSGYRLQICLLERTYKTVAKISDNELFDCLLVWKKHNNKKKIMVGWLFINVPSTARSFREGTPIYCPWLLTSYPILLISRWNLKAKKTRVLWLYCIVLFIVYSLDIPLI